CEIDEATLDVGVDELDADAISDIELLESVHESSLSGRMNDSDPCPLRRSPGHDGIESFADPRFEEQRRCGLSHLTFHLGRAVFLLCAVSGQSTELFAAIRCRSSLERCLQHALREEIGKTPIRCGRVGVVLDGKSEVSLRLSTRKLKCVFTPAQELHDRKRKIRKARGICLSALAKKLFEGPGGGFWWQAFA